MWNGLVLEAGEGPPVLEIQAGGSDARQLR